MNDLKLNQEILFNPPLRIFTSKDAEASAASTEELPRFNRPKLTRFVKHDRIARYFVKRRPNLRAPQD